MRVGLENFALDAARLATDWGRVGLLCNQASVDLSLRPAWQIFHEKLGKRLRALFGPQHGFAGTAQDNMIETGHGRHLATGLPVYSLYSETREPTEEMLAGIDTLVIDLQITGCRIYTWKATIVGCLKQAKKFNKKIVILDRPNPVGGVDIEGLVLRPDAQSFVGQITMPMRHGLTAAEAALVANEDIDADLVCVPLSDWNPSSMWPDLQRTWVPTSPNLPTVDPLMIYPGMVIFEGTNVSEGRGTGLPFQLLGAPYIKDAAGLISKAYELLPAEGRYFLRETDFQPTYQKWQGEVCHGLQVHVLDPRGLPSFSLAILLVKLFKDFSDGCFAWKQPPYEYNYEDNPFNLILGDLQADAKFERQQFDLSDPFWHEGCDRYIDHVSRVLLYLRQQRVLRV